MIKSDVTNLRCGRRMQPILPNLHARTSSRGGGLANVNFYLGCTETSSPPSSSLPHYHWRASISGGKVDDQLQEMHQKPFLLEESTRRHHEESSEILDSYFHAVLMGLSKLKLLLLPNEYQLQVPYFVVKSNLHIL